MVKANTSDLTIAGAGSDPLQVPVYEYLLMSHIYSCLCNCDRKPQKIYLFSGIKSIFNATTTTNLKNSNK